MRRARPGPLPRLLLCGHGVHPVSGVAPGVQLIWAPARTDASVGPCHAQLCLRGHPRALMACIPHFHVQHAAARSEATSRPTTARPSSCPL